MEGDIPWRASLARADSIHSEGVSQNLTGSQPPAGQAHVQVGTTFLLVNQD